MYVTTGTGRLCYKKPSMLEHHCKYRCYVSLSSCVSHRRYSVFTLIMLLMSSYSNLVTSRSLAQTQFVWSQVTHNITNFADFFSSLFSFFLALSKQLQIVINCSNNNWGLTLACLISLSPVLTLSSRFIQHVETGNSHTRPLCLCWPKPRYYDDRVWFSVQ